MSIASVDTSADRRQDSSVRLARDLHPVAWWVWAIGLAVAASSTTNPLLLLLLISVTALVVATRRSSQPWGSTFRLYVVLGLVIVVTRVAFRLLFGGSYPGTVILDLPEIGLPDFVLGITLLGPVTRESLLYGLYDGLRLAAVVICIGAANSLANPKRLLRSVPPALYEIGTALVVAVTVLPQLVESVQRVRRAQQLRVGHGGRIRGLRRLLVPVLEDALERSLTLAAGMDTRGYGRSGGADHRQRRITGALMLIGLGGICVGTYAVLDRTAPRVLALPMLGLGLAAAVAGFASAGRRVRRTRYRADRWQWPEVAVVVSGSIVGVVGWWLSGHQVFVAYPPLDRVPSVSLTALIGLLAGAAAAFVSPPPADPGGA